MFQKQLPSFLRLSMLECLGTPGEGEVGGCPGVEESCAGEERGSEVCVWLLSVASALLKICTEGVALSQHGVVRCVSALLEHTKAYVVKPRSLALVPTLVLSLLQMQVIAGCKVIQMWRCINKM